MGLQDVVASRLVIMVKRLTHSDSPNVEPDSKLSDLFEDQYLNKEFLYHLNDDVTGVADLLNGQKIKGSDLSSVDTLNDLASLVVKKSSITTLQQYLSTMTTRVSQELSQAVACNCNPELDPSAVSDFSKPISAFAPGNSSDLETKVFSQVGADLQRFILTALVQDDFTGPLSGVRDHIVEKTV